MSPAALVIATLAAVLGPALAYIAASRKLSGRIDTSEASSLWEESASIRQDYRQRLADSEARIARLEGRLGEMEQTNIALTRDNAALAEENEACKRTIEQLQVRVDALAAENAELRQLIEGT